MAGGGAGAGRLRRGEEAPTQAAPSASSLSYLRRFPIDKAFVDGFYLPVAATPAGQAAVP